MSSQADLDEVIARERFRDLVSRYKANGDTDRFELVRELFCDDAVMRIGRTTTHTGIDAIMSVFTGASDGNAQPGGPSHVRHFTATHQIDLVDATNAKGRLYFAVLTDVGLDHWGVYMDTYRVDDGRWKFASRRVTIDGYAPNSLFPRVD